MTKFSWAEHPAACQCCGLSHIACLKPPGTGTLGIPEPKFLTASWSGLGRHCHLHSEMCQRRQAGRKSGRRSSVLEHFLKNHEIQAQCPQENQPSRHVLFWLSQNLRNLEKAILSSWPLNWAPKMMCWKAEQNLFAYAHLSYNHWTDKSKSFWIQPDARLRWIV